MNSTPGASESTFAAQLLESLPAAVFVIDEVGTIAFASRRAADLVGRDPADVVGESVLGFVAADTAWAYAAAVAMATDYADTTMGPLRVTLTGENQTPVTADLWATNHLGDPEVGGIVCLMTPETTAMGLGEAVAALASREPLEETTSRVVTALRGHPVAADALVYRRLRGELGSITVAGEQLEGLVDPTPTIESLVASVLERGTRRLSPDLLDVPDDLRETAHAAGYRSLWIEPVGPVGPLAEQPLAALALWRPHDGAPSPNELNSVYQAAAILALALTLDQPPA